MNRRHLRLSQTERSIEEARQLKFPILITSSLYHRPFGPDMLRKLHEELPGSRLSKTPESGHTPYFEHPRFGTLFCLTT